MPTDTAAPPPLHGEAEERPPLASVLSGLELRRWYWLKDELTAFARVLGVSTSGGKLLLTERIAAALDGVEFAEPARPRSAGTQLAGVLTATTLVPAGQRCSQAVRAWFSAELGRPFRFDARMRDWFAAADGTRTLGDALIHHLLDEDTERPEIGAQFEYNRFARDWYAANPGGDPEQMRALWHVHRARPRPAYALGAEVAEVQSSNDVMHEVSNPSLQPGHP